VRHEHGYTMIELLIALGLVTILAGISVPVFIESSRRNQVWTAAESVGGSIRQARLRAISRNRTYRIAFNCPRPASLRILVVTGDASVDNAEDRCTTYFAEEGDGGEIVMPQGVTFGDVPTLEVNARGLFTAIGGAVPQLITVTNGDIVRIVRVSAAGQVTLRTEAEEEVAEDDAGT
jgi:prepilin-type N-terminal cleavage/methylation domain-containing protein